MDFGSFFVFQKRRQKNKEQEISLRMVSKKHKVETKASQSCEAGLWCSLSPSTAGSMRWTCGVMETAGGRPG